MPAGKSPSSKLTPGIAETATRHSGLAPPLLPLTVTKNHAPPAARLAAATM